MINPVFNYLSENKGMKLSVKSLSKRLNMKRRSVFYLIKHDSNIRQVTPMEVGSLAFCVSVFTIDE